MGYKNFTIGKILSFLCDYIRTHVKFNSYVHKGCCNGHSFWSCRQKGHFPKSLGFNSAVFIEEVETIVKSWIDYVCVFYQDSAPFHKVPILQFH